MLAERLPTHHGGIMLLLLLLYVDLPAGDAVEGSSLSDWGVQTDCRKNEQELQEPVICGCGWMVRFLPVFCREESAARKRCN